MHLRMVTLGLFALITAGALGAFAASAQQTINPSSPIQQGSRTTYLDLLRKLMPDAGADATANNTIPLRSITQPHQKQAITGRIKFDFEPHWFNSDGKRLLMLRLDLTAADANQGTPYEGEAVVLAVFGLEPTITLLDALEIKTDRFTGFWKDQPLFPLNAQNDAFIVSSSHWNAGENYSRLDVLFADEGRLKSITNQFLFETQGCGTTFTETPSFRAIAASGRKYPDILIRVKLTKEPDELSCERRTPGYTKYYQGRYFWNPGKRRYEGGSRQLQMLARFNKKRIFSP
jgi:hypothetical protein